jgi:pilus assembly protein CpaE
LLAAPATLDRVLDFGESSFDSLIDVMRASTPWIVVDVPHIWSAWAPQGVAEAVFAPERVDTVLVDRLLSKCGARRILILADEVIVIASPDLANLRNAKNLIDNVKSARLNDAPPRLVLNGVGMLKRPEIAAAEPTGVGSPSPEAM